MAMSLEPVINTLLETPYARWQGTDYIYVRCPLCGDSMKHLNGTHCSIWIKEGQPLIYHCWICEESGIVNASFLEKLEVHDLQIANMIGQYNKAAGRKPSTSFRMAKDNLKFEIPQIVDNQINELKLKYMQERLGIPFTYNSIEALRIVFSLVGYLNLNKVSWNPKYKKSMFYLERDGIGFVSTTKDMVNLRLISTDAKYRYIKYPLFQNSVGSEQMYMIPSQLDIFAPEIDLHVCEGPFDILGVFFNVRKAYLKNQVYAAVGGVAYHRVLRYLLLKGFLLNLNVHIYSDLDKEPEFYDELIEEYKPWVKSFHLYYNRYKGEKDFGVPKDRIILKEAEIRR